MSELHSPKQQREQLVRSLRAAGKSRVEVAEALRQRYHFNARVAFRYAHEWSQRQAADEWNRRWPDELKTFRHLDSAPATDSMPTARQALPAQPTDTYATNKTTQYGDNIDRRRVIKTIGAGAMLYPLIGAGHGPRGLVLNAAHSSAALHSAIG